MKLLVVLLAWALGAAASAASRSPEFEACLTDLQRQARDAEVAEAIVAEVFPALEQQQRVIELDRKQPEFVQTFAQYFSARVTQQRIDQGRKLYARHGDFLRELSWKYGVPGQYLVAFWGLETNFGGYMGKMPTLDSLATLACDERRSEFFTTEFITALQLLERESLQPAQMRGSWAGAMGHTQFMPSAYIQYAVDGDGDGRIDLWQSTEDALASAANFLQQLGWESGLRWGREVTLPDDFPYERAGTDTKLSLEQWAGYGVLRGNGNLLPVADVEGSILVPAGARGPAFLVYPNFAVIMRWNRSESYALSVGHLADRIAGGGGLYRKPPEGQKPLSREQTEEAQRRLNAAGYAAGPEDGIFGPATRTALSAFQRDIGVTADGFPDQASLERLREFQVEQNDDK
jgi:membrane-bound lytic murein transglycosylase B